MLEHEPQETPASQTSTAQTSTAQIPAAQRRVSAEELTRAVSALEDAKAAERIAGVAPIGQIVDELGLDSTPEEIWVQVQKQRAEAAPKPQVQPVPMLQNPKVGRQVRRGWRGMRGWIWVIFWCTGGFGLLTGLPHLLHTQNITPGQTITIDADALTQPINVQGKDVVISGDKDKITLQGTAKSVEINGDFTTVTGDAPQSYVISGDGDIVHFKAAAKPVKP
jgi:hypothetical protein